MRTVGWAMPCSTPSGPKVSESISSPCGPFRTAANRTSSSTTMALERDPLSKRLNTSSSKRPDISTDSLLDHVPLLNILSPQDRQRILPELSETRNGKECTLKMLMPGDLFCCDAAAFDGGCHPGTAQPMGNVSILRMHRKAYFDMLKRNPDAAMEVIKYLGNRLNEAQEKAKILALDRADQRLAALLADLGARNGVKETQGVRLPMRLTRQDMANMIGATTETVIRIMSRFKRARLVSGTANRLVILNLQQLKAFASG